MIPYVGCERARELLDAFLDDELQLADQVAVESHLRWCRTCCLRVEDMRLIGASLRLGSPRLRSGGDDTQVLSATSASTLMRARAERQQSLPVRIREMFVDMRLLWPLIGATAAVIICVSVAFSVLQAATVQRPDSLAAMIQTLGTPGSERNPMRPDGGNSMPRVVDDGMLDSLSSEDGQFTVRTVVGRDGRIDLVELLETDRSSTHGRTALHDRHVDAVLDAVRQSRFAPAQSPMGQAIAVNMVWVIVVTTAEKEKANPRAFDAVVAAPPPRIQPIAIDVFPPVDRRSATPRPLTTA
jgi:hypothetical protein